MTLAEILVLITGCGLVLGAIRQSIADINARASFPSFHYFFGAFFGWFLAWNLVRARRRVRPCAECGRPFIPPENDKRATLCPPCRTRSLTADQMRQERKKGRRTLIIALGLLLVFSELLAWLGGGYRMGAGAWLVVPLAAFGCVTAFFLVLVAIGLGIALTRQAVLRFEGPAFSRAGKASGKAGVISRSETLVVWSSDPPDPLPWLAEHQALATRRFEKITGRPIERRGPDRVLCFSQRSAFLAYYRDSHAPLWTLDGLYSKRPVRMLTLATEATPYRVSDADRMVRTLFAFALIDDWKGIVFPPWLQHALGHLVAADSDTDYLDRLQRKVRVALVRGTALGPDEVFGTPHKAMFRMAGSWKDHASALRYLNFSAQSCSIGDYLGGAGATDERRGRFGAFLEAMGPKGLQATIFEHHLGRDPVQLFNGWRAWVEAQVPGEHRPTPPAMAGAIRGRLVPTALDEKANRMDRVLAIRDMGRLGYVAGSDALIALRRRGDGLKEEAIWALEAISRETIGDDVDRWAAWWDGLPTRLRSEGALPHELRPMS
jgi:hypothetical protein